MNVGNIKDQSSCGSLLQQLDHVLAPMPFREIPTGSSTTSTIGDISAALLHQPLDNVPLVVVPRDVQNRRSISVLGRDIGAALLH